jgi:hypothetical protein
MRQVCFSVYDLAKHSLLGDTFQMVVQNLSGGLLLSLHALKMVARKFHCGKWKI